MSDEHVRWLRPLSEERKRRHRRGWMLVLALGGFVGAGAAVVDALNGARSPLAVAPAPERGPALARADITPPAAAPAARDTAAVPTPMPSPGPEAASDAQVPPGRPDTISETGAVAQPGIVLAQPPSGATGWWIILGSVPEGGEAADGTARQAVEAARRCGVDPVSGRSSDFEGLAPGLVVYLEGPHDRGGAQQGLRRVTPCVPDAYVKWAKHRSTPGNAASASGAQSPR